MLLPGIFLMVQAEVAEETTTYRLGKAIPNKNMNRTVANNTF